MSCLRYPECHGKFDPLGHPDLGLGRPYVPLGQVKGIRSSGSNYNKMYRQALNRYFLFLVLSRSQHVLWGLRIHP